MHVAAVKDRGLQAHRLDMRKFDRPVGAEAAAPRADARAVDVRANGQVGHHRRKHALGIRVGERDRILAGAGTVDEEGRESRPVHDCGIALMVFFPDVHTAPVHDDRRARHAVRHLQIADQRRAFEWNLDDVERGLEVACRLAKRAPGMTVGRPFLR